MQRKNKNRGRGNRECERNEKGEEIQGKMESKMMIDTQRYEINAKMYARNKYRPPGGGRNIVSEPNIDPCAMLTVPMS
jgi:hypothetical protein